MFYERACCKVTPPENRAKEKSSTYARNYY
jgi:hypothetical protein